ncbi:hypothetical protein [Vallitalea sp.]|jgi:hypothetical protein|uniref:hypothetical protein n=1 Tax=Vallitalea sp. TaxID=1882829 RepID=UPI0025E6A72C|nr:hypothetical protein [Vallitalea sp.]MCT4686606.1 hypothetical protein [Vallitalea sp.]
MKLSKLNMLRNEKTKILCDFKEIRIMNKGKKNEYAIDQRTKRATDGLITIYPIAFQNGYYWYICSDCGEVHASKELGKIVPSCCIDNDCERHQYINGNHHLIQREPVYLISY